MTPRIRIATIVLIASSLLAAGAAFAQETAKPSKQLAPGFSTRAAGSKLVVLPADMELFSISAGGVTEPRADWTEAAQKNFDLALVDQGPRLGVSVTRMTPQQADEFADVAALHRAVAQAIYVHHTRGLKLPTKNERLDWSLGDAVKPIQARTGADYALFTWVRDSYASGERKLALAAMALLGAIPLGGEQIGYASLVDLRTGRIVWFNELHRFWGDLREAKPAAETVDALLKGFPEQKK